NHPVTAYVFPHDKYNDELIQKVLKIHQFVRVPELLRSTYDKSVVIPYGGPYFSVQTANRLVDVGIERGLWIVAAAHGVRIPGTIQYKPVDTSFLEEHLSYIHSKLS